MILRARIVAILRRPPNKTPAHVDRLPWDQVDLIADSILSAAGTNWKPIDPRTLEIDHDDMVLIRKPNRKGGYNVDLAYPSKGAGWRLSQSGVSGIQGYLEWCPIPK